MMGTGTGVAPYLAMLKKDVDILKHYRNILFVHSVRKETHLCYQKELNQYAQQYSKFHYIPIVTKPKDSSNVPLNKHIQTLLGSNELAQHCNLPITKQDSFIMLCGRPDMIKESIEALKTQGLNKHRRRKPGNIVSERYF